MEARRAYRVRITGIVQGVGFRPYVYRLASETGVKGYVRNLGGSEVEIHVEGSGEKVERFLRLLVPRKPPRAVIEEVKVEEAEPKGYVEFTIMHSSSSLSARSMIPPDIGICSECLREVLDPGSRWYRYPFHSCVNCGPRFSMMYRTPYDRSNTSMRDFPLCEECLAEYRDPGNTRRFHAQGISCPRCGPRVYLVDSSFKPVETRDPIVEAARLIDEGAIVAVKGLGGFHIASLATDDDVLARLRKVKERPSKPFALMALDINIAEKLCVVSRETRELLESPEKPIVLMPRRPGSPASRLVAPGLDTLGVMLPYTALHYLLLDATRDKFLVMTSGNKKGRPMCIDEECARRELAGIADYFLLHNRRIVNRVDDSVLRLTAGQPVFIRRSRGYAPRWIRLPYRLPDLVAFGADLQTAGAVAFEDKVVLTQYIGDIDDPAVLIDYDRYLSFFTRTYSVSPRAVVVDKHPGYHSRKLGVRWAEKLGVPVVEVQHHHAHALQAMAELGMDLEERITAVTIDGTGYGDDGSIWGGEVIHAWPKGYERLGHIETFPLPGGDRAAYYPVRSLIGLLSKTMDEDEVLGLLRRRGLLKGLPRGEAEARIAYRQASQGKAPMTSSLGRLVDAVSALLGISLERTYEGEPAIKLEEAARKGRLIEGLEDDYLVSRNGVLIVDASRIISDLLGLLSNSKVEDLARTFLYRLGIMLGRIAVRKLTPIIAVSGGAAVNDFIVEGIRSVVEEKGSKIYIPRLTPPGDGGIALGQAVAAAAYRVAD